MGGIKALEKISVAECVPKRKIRWKPVSWLCLALVFTPIIAYFLFNGFPVVLSFISMFTDMQANDITTMEWNGFDNFRQVLTEPKIWG